MFAFEPSAPNVTPTRYRQVALSTNVDNLDADWLIKHFSGREAYMRTRFIVARCGGDSAVLEVARPEDSGLFSRIREVRVLAPPNACRYVVAPAIDTAVPSQLARLAMEHPRASCIVVEGRYSHVSFLLNPAPLVLNVFDVVPPFPSKLLDQVQRVLDMAEDLPPIVAVPSFVDSREELERACNPLPAEVLAPCRGAGIDITGANASFLDERPSKRDWILLGCERSQQIHRWFYGSAAPIVDICPNRFLDGRLGGAQTIARCCLIQEGVEERSRATYVPWGASLAEVREAIDRIVRKVGVPWTRT
ncbi:DUF7714 family protein [Methylocystis iwaonis]|uniref:Uncharacterized protein n=1 Tax=Methylocystis iwaonis TaxID=2885079 RepID=A0ABM8EDX8_9HYPH|nr:hypothetical protein SS37A_37500 [Methylocystis iwaonis]